MFDQLCWFPASCTHLVWIILQQTRLCTQEGWFNITGCLEPIGSEALVTVMWHVSWSWSSTVSQRRSNICSSWYDCLYYSSPAWLCLVHSLACVKWAKQRVVTHLENQRTRNCNKCSSISKAEHRLHSHAALTDGLHPFNYNWEQQCIELEGLKEKPFSILKIIFPQHFI